MIIEKMLKYVRFQVLTATSMKFRVFYYGPPPICHWPTSSPIVTHSPLVSPVHLDSYIISYLFAQGSLIALMMEAARTSETSVNINLTTRQYIPEDSKIHC